MYVCTLSLLCREPEELGPMALLLVLPKSKGITGQVISVDGGYKI
jgi:enoyl-[acyl-carrier-protein] reductase (NADH)